MKEQHNIQDIALGSIDEAGLATEDLETTFTAEQVAAAEAWKQWKILTGELALRDSIQPQHHFEEA